MRNNNEVKLAQNCFWDKKEKVLTNQNRVIKLTGNQTKLLNFLINASESPVSNIDIYYYVFEDSSKEFNAKSIRNLVSNIKKRCPELNIINYYGGSYVLKYFHANINDFRDYLPQILDQAKVGITITDPNQEDNPIIYINESFSEIFGYDIDDVYGKNCRFLHGEDHDQEAIAQMRQAIHEMNSINVIVRNYTIDKSQRLIDVTISPIFDHKNGSLKYFLGIQKDITNNKKY